MHIANRSLLFAVLVTVSGAAMAQASASGAWTRATAPGQDSAAVYLTLKSSADTVLKSVDSPAGQADMHEMRMDGNVMRMRTLPQVPVPAGKAVEFSPSGNHIMVNGLKKPLAKGGKLPLVLHFVGRDGKTQDVKVEAEVRGLDAAPGSSGGMPGMNLK
jgi:copper(I)-binding protein